MARHRASLPYRKRKQHKYGVIKRKKDFKRLFPRYYYWEKANPGVPLPPNWVNDHLEELIADFIKGDTTGEAEEFIKRLRKNRKNLKAFFYQRFSALRARRKRGIVRPISTSGDLGEQTSMERAFSPLEYAKLDENQKAMRRMRLKILNNQNQAELRAELAARIEELLKDVELIPGFATLSTGHIPRTNSNPLPFSCSTSPSTNFPKQTVRNHLPQLSSRSKLARFWR